MRGRSLPTRLGRGAGWRRGRRTAGAGARRSPPGRSRAPAGTERRLTDRTLWSQSQAPERGNSRAPLSARSPGGEESRSPAESPPSVRERKRFGKDPDIAPTAHGAEAGREEGRRRRINTEDGPVASRGRERRNLRRRNPSGNPNRDRDLNHEGEDPVRLALGEEGGGVGLGLGQGKDVKDLVHDRSDRGQGLTSPLEVLYRPSHNGRGAAAGLGPAGNSQDDPAHDVQDGLQWRMLLMEFRFCQLY